MSKHRATGLVVVGLHPVIDRTIEVPSLTTSNNVIRGMQIMLEPAGKGMNVARTLATLGRKVTVTGFLGREEIPVFEAALVSRRISSRFVAVAVATRDSVTIIARDTGRDTHIICDSMSVTREEIAQLRAALAEVVKPGNLVIFCGSFPHGMRQDAFKELLCLCGDHQARACVDTAGGMLRAAVRTNPWLITPNAAELAALTRQKIATRKQALTAARGLLRNCHMVLVSLGAKGAILVSEAGAWHACDPRPGKVIHTVGCGDALLAGFVAALSSAQPVEEALCRGVACGSECAASPRAALNSRKNLDRIVRRIHLSML